MQQEARYLFENNVWKWFESRRIWEKLHQRMYWYLIIYSAWI